jgi:bifunctional UDP-N-acetylglucosamine pyrophosphorylase/glucosamine-1-phosphate N-acetyltransferase
MVMHVIHSLADVDVDTTVVVVGHGADRVTAAVRDEAPEWAGVRFTVQNQQRGTGDAALVGLSGLAGDDIDDTSTVLVMPGDTPLLTPSTVASLVSAHELSGNAATVLTSVLDDPSGYGRVVRDRHRNVRRIVEHRDATPDELRIGEVNTGIYAFRRDLLGPALRKIGTDNAQGEYYLTDVVSVLASGGHTVGAVAAAASETSGVNDRFQLAVAERELRDRINTSWLLAGVTMLDPAQAFIDAHVSIGRDVTLYPGVILQGRTVIGNRCEIGPGTRLVDTTVGDGATVTTTSATNATIGAGATVGPWAHLGAGTVVAEGHVTGPFYTRGS